MEAVKLFKHGKNQTVTLPEKYLCDEEEVYLKKIGNAVVLIPVKNFWAPLLGSLDGFSDDFMNERQQPEAFERDFF